MIAGSCQVESGDSAFARIGRGNALIAVLGLAVLFSMPASGADWDPAATTRGLRMPDSLLSLRDMYPDLATRTAGREFSREFQPRTSAFPAASPEVELRGSAGLDRSGNLPQTSPWQRMGDFRSENGIMLLTVWQNAGGTVALHQRNGGASLQWTSHALNRGGASRGLLDHLFYAARATRAPLRPAAMRAPAPAPALAARFATP